MKTLTKGIKDLQTTVSTCPEPETKDLGLLSEEDILLINKAREIIDKYSNPNWIEELPVSIIQGDAVTLQAIQVSLAEKFGSIAARQEAEEEHLKVARSKYRVAIKEEKSQLENNGDAVKVTAEDIKDLSYAKTEDLWRRYQQIKHTASRVKYIYYSIRDHIGVLDRAAHRLYRIGE
jgi:hypothetical protein